MHLFCENNIPNLVALWMGRFKGLDEGSGSYIIPDEVWVEIARESAAAVMQSFIDAGGIDARIAHSYADMQEGLRHWSEVSAQSFLIARNEA